VNRVRSTDYRRLLLRTLVAVAVCAVAVVICYEWIDRPVAFFVHDGDVSKVGIYKFLTEPPPLVQLWSPAVLALLLARRARGAWTTWQATLFTACVSMIIADQFREMIGDLAGRYWPETWHNDNPSLIGTGTYGFHPFIGGDDTGSFPSGHAARVVAFAGVWWLAVPRSRMLWILVCPPLVASLVLMDYHFVGDVVAGSVLGGIVAAYATALAGLDAGARRSTT